MPALPSVTDVLKLTTKYSYSGNTSVQVRTYLQYSASPPTTTEITALCTTADSAWATHLRSLCSGDVHQLGHAAEDLNSNTGAVGFTSVDVTGTRSGDGLPKATCFEVQHLIARRYRGGKPKGFHPFGSATDLTGTGTWNNTMIGAVTTGWEAFIAEVLAGVWSGGGTLTHVNVSYFEGFTVVTSPTTHRARNVPTLRGTPVVDEVVGYGYEIDVASQRRRNQV